MKLCYKVFVKNVLTVIYLFYLDMSRKELEVTFCYGLRKLLVEILVFLKSYCRHSALRTKNRQTWLEFCG